MLFRYFMEIKVCFAPKMPPTDLYEGAKRLKYALYKLGMLLFAKNPLHCILIHNILVFVRSSHRSFLC